jgi:hypothetical protein
MTRLSSGMYISKGIPFFQAEFRDVYFEGDSIFWETGCVE